MLALNMAQPRTLPYSVSRPSYNGLSTDYYVSPTAAAVGYGNYTSPPALIPASCPYPVATANYCYQATDTTSPSYDQSIDSPTSTLPSPQTPNKTLSPASATAEETNMSEHYDASYDGQQYGGSPAPVDTKTNNGYIYSPGYLYTSSPSNTVYSASTTTPSFTSCYFSNYPSLAVPTNDSCMPSTSTYPTYGPTSGYFTGQPYSTLQDYTSPAPAQTIGLTNGYWSSNCSTANQLTAVSPKISYDSPRYKLTPERAIPLQKWFEEHREHPYPSRHEKMLLCQSTQLTFTQVSTWFANARRRLKKSQEDEEEDGTPETSPEDQET